MVLVQQSPVRSSKMATEKNKSVGEWYLFPYLELDTGADVFVNLKSLQHDGRARVISVSHSIPKTSIEDVESINIKKNKVTVSVDYLNYDKPFKHQMCEIDVSRIVTRRKRRIQTAHTNVQDDSIRTNSSSNNSSNNNNNNNSINHQSTSCHGVPIFLTDSTAEFRRCAAAQVNCDSDLVMEIGCSTGECTELLLKKGLKQILAVDVSDELLIKTRERVKKYLKSSYPMDVTSCVKGLSNDNIKGASNDLSGIHDIINESSSSSMVPPPQDRQHITVEYFDLFLTNNHSMEFNLNQTIMKEISSIVSSGVSDTSSSSSNNNNNSNSRNVCSNDNFQNKFRAENISVVLLDIGGERNAQQVLKAIDVCCDGLSGLQVLVVKSKHLAQLKRVMEKSQDLKEEAIIIQKRRANKEKKLRNRQLNKKSAVDALTNDDRIPFAADLNSTCEISTTTSSASCSSSSATPSSSSSSLSTPSSVINAQSGTVEAIVNEQSGGSDEDKIVFESGSDWSKLFYIELEKQTNLNPHGTTHSLSSVVGNDYSFSDIYPSQHEDATSTKSVTTLKVVERSHQLKERKERNNNQDGQHDDQDDNHLLAAIHHGGQYPVSTTQLKKKKRRALKLKA